MGNKNSENVQVDDWYSMCCILDLCQIEDNEDLEFVIGLLEDNDIGLHTWKTLKEAVDEIVNDWGYENLDDRPDLKLLLENDKGE